MHSIVRRALLRRPEKDGFIIHDERGKALLVITRRIGEEIVIDDKVTVVVLAVQGDRVRLGIGAPAKVRMNRQEVQDRRPFAPILPMRWKRGPRALVTDWFKRQNRR
jgi:carbon storage regulator